KEKYKRKNNVKLIGLRPGEKIHELMINYSEVPRTYDFENLYVITSCIGNCPTKNKPGYVKKGELINESKMEEYSSKDAVISKEKVKKLFKQLNLL
ncbi:MAG: polysaccharide biosynthesis protein, partial [Candidatus Moranbacteria bacterium]|nr:polysaccharide biosynthesis protein [Candidatus Moranbacteria bacterium]